LTEAMPFPLDLNFDDPHNEKNKKTKKPPQVPSLPRRLLLQKQLPRGQVRLPGPPRHRHLTRRQRSSVCFAITHEAAADRDGSQNQPGNPRGRVVASPHSGLAPRKPAPPRHQQLRPEQFGPVDGKALGAQEVRGGVRRGGRRRLARVVRDVAGAGRGRLGRDLWRRRRARCLLLAASGLLREGERPGAERAGPEPGPQRRDGVCRRQRGQLG